MKKKAGLEDIDQTNNGKGPKSSMGNGWVAEHHRLVPLDGTRCGWLRDEVANELYMNKEKSRLSLSPDGFGKQKKRVRGSR